MQPEGSETGAVSITVLSVKPMRSGKLFALASVELDIDGVRIEIHGIRALRVDPVGTRIPAVALRPIRLDHRLSSLGPPPQRRRAPAHANSDSFH